MRCRACDAPVIPVVDLGPQPVAARFPLPSDPPDVRMPLRLGICTLCGLAQLADHSPPEEDDPDAPPPTSSATMAAHARSFVAELAGRGLSEPGSRVLSIASHGGHIVPFLADTGLRATVVEASPKRAERLRQARVAVLEGALDGDPSGVLPAGDRFDLIVDNYLLAHLDRPRRALATMAALLAPGGTLVLEFDHLLAKVAGGQWDAIRHGHAVYLTLDWLTTALHRVGLVVVDAAAQPVYGGAMRIYARAGGAPGPAVARLVAEERAAGLGDVGALASLATVVEQARTDVVAHLRAARDGGHRVVGYGAPGRSVTFLNALAIDCDLLAYVVDRSPAKQGRTIPGVRIPIRPPEVLAQDRPGEVLILAWNLAAEVVRTMRSTFGLTGTRFSVAVPALTDVG